MFKETDSGLIIKIKIVPNSSKNDIIIEDEFVKVKVTAQPIENRQEIIAAVSAVIAEELGTDINALRIISFKKI